MQSLGCHRKGEEQLSLQDVETQLQRRRIGGWALLEQRKAYQLNFELREGRAYIYCTLDTNKVEKYEIRISGIDTSARGNKCISNI